MLEPWRGRRPRRAQLCSGAVVTVLSSPWQTRDVGTEEAVGTGTGIPPRAWGSVLKTQVQGGAAGKAAGPRLVSLCVGDTVVISQPYQCLGCPGWLMGQEPEASPKPQRTQNWNLMPRATPWSVGLLSCSLTTSLQGEQLLTPTKTLRGTPCSPK